MLLRRHAILAPRSAKASAVEDILSGTSFYETSVSARLNFFVAMERLLGPSKAVEMILGAVQSLDVCREVSDLALQGTQKTCTRRHGHSFRGQSVWTLPRSVARRLQRCVPEDLEGCTGGDRYRWALCCSLQAAHTTASHC